MSEPAPPAPKTRRKTAPQDRRRAILAAGLAVFAADGFAAAKLDDVAVKAGIAKGTIYLHFKDKHDLFEQIALNAVTPVMAQLQTMAALPDLPTGDLLAMLFNVFRQEILATDRKLVARLLLTEGGRFPKIAAFYHREVVSKGLALIRFIAARGVKRGDLPPNGLEIFPHLALAPLLMIVLWDDLFSTIAPLDAEGLLAAHRKILTGEMDGMGAGG